MNTARFEHEIAEAWRRFPPPAPDNDDIVAARLAWNEYFAAIRAQTPGNKRDGVAVEDLCLRSQVDEHLIPARIYRPLSAISGRGLVYFHGGGFVIGDLDIEEERCVALARQASCVVVSVDYRLAPEHPYPTPVEDCYSALTWVAEHAPELSIDEGRLAIGGCSAGGALTATVAQLCRDRGTVSPAMQALFYPVLDASLTEPSMSALLDEEELRETRQMWEDYLGEDAGAAQANGASPAHCEDLSGLPPAYIVAAELDALRDEAISYARALLCAGISVELQVWPKTPHAFDLFVPTAAISREAMRRQAEAVVRFLG